MASRSRTARLARDALLNAAVGSYLVPRRARWRLLRVCGLRVERSTISARCFFGGRDLAIGRETFVNYGCFFDCAAPITIGSWCRIGMEVMFCTGTHGIGGAGQRAGIDIALPISVGDGCWIGARAVILPGVTIGDGCIISAGALVTNDCEPDGMYVGAPARRVRDLER
jgi:maltose O-acetyltransferase